MVLPDDNSSARQYRISGDSAGRAAALALIAILLLAVLVSAAFVRVGSARTDARLTARNQALEQELGRMAVQLDSLDRSLTGLAGKDEHYRLVAGLEPLHEDVLLAGIGGPDGDGVEARGLYAVDPAAAQRAHDVATHLDALLRRADLLRTSWTEAEETLTDKHDVLRATPSIVPTQGYVSSSFSSSRWHPILDRARAHKGIDIAAPTGTPVVATANGRIVSAGPNGPNGLLIEIDHGHGMVTRYAHLSRIDVKRGQTVQRGHPIGAVGTSGLSTGPHLHYEVLVNGRYINPNRHIFDLDVLPL